MNLSKASSVYAFCDGTINSISIFYDEGLQPYVLINLMIRKKIKKKYVPCELLLRLSEIIEIGIYEDMKSGSDYSDIKLEEFYDGYYISLDPFDNESGINEKDNMVFQCKKLELDEVST